MPASDLLPVPSPRFVSVDVEITNFCSNSCLMCPRYAISRPRGMMEQHTFGRLLAFLGGSRCLLTFSGMGDPLLHPLLPEFLRRASDAGHETGVVVHPASLVHEVEGLSGMKRLLSHPPHSITVSFPSVRREVFERLSPAMRFDDALSLVQELQQCLPRRIRVSGIISRLNEDEEEEYRLFWKGLKVPCWVTRCHSRGGNLKGSELMLKDAKSGIEETGVCSLFLFHSFVSWNGDLLSCCHDLSNETAMGNLFDLGHYRDLLALKERFFSKLPCPPFALCRKCDEPLRNVRFAALPDEGKSAERRKFFSKIASSVGMGRR